MSFIPEDRCDLSFKGLGLLKNEGKKGIRPELRELKKNEDMWNLYLLGLWQLQLVPMENQFSYFKMAGIHGEPYQAWPKIKSKELESVRKGGPKGSFCTHSSILFLSWHRPYLALFESVLKNAMCHVADKFTKEEGKDRYLKAAKDFHMPYWDWARGDLPRFPEEATEEFVTVQMPERLFKEMQMEVKQGKHKVLHGNKFVLEKQCDGCVKIWNPLHSYRFQEGIDEQDYMGEDEKTREKAHRIKIAGLNRTARHHLVKGGEATKDQDEKNLLIEDLTSAVNEKVSTQHHLASRMIYLLRAYKSFAQVSNNKAGESDIEGYGSFEDIHNAIHGFVGGDNKESGRDGHMSHVEKAAFDPIFWLHHTNIDRLLAMWQVINNDPLDEEIDTWVTNVPAGDNSWITPKGTDEGPQTPLAPFYKEQGTFWTSDDVRDTTKFGYVYPETHSGKRKHVEEKLDELYPYSSLASMIAAESNTKLSIERPQARLEKRADLLAKLVKIHNDKTIPVEATEKLARALASGTSGAYYAQWEEIVQKVEVDLPYRSLADLVDNGNYLEWLVNIEAVKHEMEGKYSVHVFVGPVSDHESTACYGVSPFQVGSFIPLGQPKETECDKCKTYQEQQTKITSQIPITIALVERYFAGMLKSLSKCDVEDYLKENLHWEVVDQKGQRCTGRKGDVKGLRVGVVSNKVKIPLRDGEYTQYNEKVDLHWKITTKPDGTGREDGTGMTERDSFRSSR